ncbi:MAG TPA: GyrI-like domain-containing protein [Longimicrobium sp.]|nr:GyrI-like domain-containing protein [Longimicrobium sp.]
MSPRYETGRAMLLVGIRRHHRFADAGATIPEQWREMRERGRVAGQTEATAYGAMCGTAGEQFEYMTAVEVDDFAHVPADLGRMRVPEQRYAVFTHEGHVSTLPETWRRIWEDWLPNSSHEPADTPDFELYDERFDARTGSGVVEIWFPIEDRLVGRKRVSVSERTETARYRIRLMFEWRCGNLWCGNDAALDRFDVGPIEDLLPLSPGTRERLEQLGVWHDQSLNWEYPPDPGPWTPEEEARFHAAATEMLATLQAELGPEFEVVYES